MLCLFVLGLESEELCWIADDFSQVVTKSLAFDSRMKTKNNFDGVSKKQEKYHLNVDVLFNVVVHTSAEKRIPVVHPVTDIQTNRIGLFLDRDSSI